MKTSSSKAASSRVRFNIGGGFLSICFLELREPPLFVMSLNGRLFLAFFFVIWSCLFAVLFECSLLVLDEKKVRNKRHHRENQDGRIYTFSELRQYEHMQAGRAGTYSDAADGEIGV
ncbi:hypothetical protein BJ741DRAFT_637109, partial [Chytriomyces cf. hyalinus JEL632]